MKEIRRISITDAVIESIKEMIKNKEYAVGEKLPTESSLCEMLKVSRTSVREAIRVLQALGYVEIKPGKGAFVADYESRDEYRNWYDVDDAKYLDFMEVRTAIEILSVRLSVERATQKQVRELEEVHSSFVKAYETDDLVHLIMLDELFHTKIASFTQNQLLININKQLLTAFRVYRSDTLTNKSVYKNAIDPHGRILFCFQIHNPSLAIEEMRKHMEISAQDMEKIHKQNGKK